jgi:dCMP deaminase
MSEIVLDRPSWDEYFLNLAKATAQRSTCPSRKVGGVIVNPETNQVISMGYNGSPRGTSHCSEECLTRESGGGWRKCRAIHAELNAVISAAMNGVSTNGATMYLTTTPCVFCSRTLINAGIKKVIALTFYPQKEAIELLEEGGVDVVVVSSDQIPAIFLER